MERLRERFQVARQALQSFQETLRPKLPTPVERDAAIQRFEYTVEAVWRAAQRYLEVCEGLVAGSPKSVIRLCREAGVLEEGEATLALEMVDERNLTAHTYNEALAQQIASHLPRYASLMAEWLDRIATHLKPSK